MFFGTRHKIPGTRHKIPATFPAHTAHAPAHATKTGTCPKFFGTHTKSVGISHHRGIRVCAKLPRSGIVTLVFMAILIFFMLTAYAAVESASLDRR